jgi:hypothetical protein
MELEKPTIHTKEPNWVENALKAYTKKIEFNLVDDGEVGLSEKDVKSAMNLLAFMKREKRLSVKDITTILISLGITASGVWIVLAAIADPEPTSKLTLLIAGGLVLALTGSLGTLRALGITYSVSAKAFGGNEFHISPNKKEK